MKRYTKLSTRQKKLAFAAIDFFVQKQIPRLANSLSVRVVGSKDLPESEGALGLCDFLDPENRYPRDFEISIFTGLSEDLFVKTILHEMVHVKQWARREMYDLKGHRLMRKWKDKKISVEETPYEEHPWEIEAYQLEEELYKEFVQQTELLRK